jgi:hypothetical protein
LRKSIELVIRVGAVVDRARINVLLRQITTDSNLKLRGPATFTPAGIYQGLVLHNKQAHTALVRIPGWVEAGLGADYHIKLGDRFRLLTGGGRTVDSNVIDVLLTWIVNRDREFLEGGTTKATKPGTKTFPYLAAPNLDLQTVAETVDVSAAPDKVWELIGQFGGFWHPLIAEIRLTGTGPGQLRTIETVDGKQIIERLDAVDNSGRFYRYANVAGLPVANYTGMLSVKPNGTGSSVEWRAQFLPNGPGTLITKTIVSTLFKAGLDSLKSRF